MPVKKTASKSRTAVKRTTAKTKPTANQPKWTKEQLVYLAGVWSTSSGLKSPKSDGNVVIAPLEYPEWTEYLVETYGGTSDTFTSARGAKFNAWQVPNELKLELLTAMENQGVLHGIHTNWRDKTRAKLEKALEK
jgi:hypothetical protein